MTVPAKQFTVAVLGAAGGIGQPLCLLLKNSPYTKTLHMYDVVPVVAGVAEDLSHIETACQVKAFVGDIKDKSISDAALAQALPGCDVVVIPAGLPRKPGMSRDDLFPINAGIVAGLVQAVCQHCPNAMVCIITNPVNSMIPIAAEIMKARKVENYEKRLFGVSTLDVVRANRFVAEAVGVDPSEVNVAVIGGHSKETIVPLLSQLKENQRAKLNDAKINELTEQIKEAGKLVVDKKGGAGSATLSMAYAGARFAISVMKGMNGEKDVVECSFVSTTLNPSKFLT